MNSSANGNNNNMQENGHIESEAASDHTQSSSQATSVTISSEQYRKLLDSSVELYRVNETIAKLRLSIEKKDAKIEHLSAQLETAQATIIGEFSAVGN